MSTETRLLTRYVNELATSRHNLYVAEDKAEQLEAQIVAKDAEIAELRQQLSAAQLPPQQAAPIEGVVVDHNFS